MDSYGTSFFPGKYHQMLLDCPARYVFFFVVVNFSEHLSFNGELSGARHSWVGRNFKRS